VGHKEVPVTQLRKQMLDELQRRNYTQTTVKGHLQIVEAFANHFHRSPDQLGPEEIRAYQVYLFTERKLNARTVGHHTAALRFFFCKTLKRAGLDRVKSGVEKQLATLDPPPDSILAGRISLHQDGNRLAVSFVRHTARSTCSKASTYPHPGSTD
jgi:integrase-like protein